MFMWVLMATPILILLFIVGNDANYKTKVKKLVLLSSLIGAAKVFPLFQIGSSVIVTIKLVL